MAIALRYAARSDVGLLRKNNQDSGYAGPHLLVVADGMGGAAGGDVASSVVVAHLAPLDDDAPSGDLLARLKDAVYAAHDELVERVAEDPSLAGLGTTVVALLRSGARLAMIHIGDSRAYLLRGGEMYQVTTDHTFVQHLVETGRIAPEEAEVHPQRSVLMRVLGDNESDILLDEWHHEAKVGDRWLLCSDGLSGVVSAETIEDVLLRVDDPGECADTLVALALHGGGPDNVTCVVADILDLDRLPDGAAPALEPQVVGAAGVDRPRVTAPGAAGRAAALETRASEPPAPSTADAGEPAKGRGRRLLARLAVTAVVLGVLAAGVWGAYAWTQNQYFVAVEDGYVAIFRGIPQEVGPVRLSELYESSDVRVTSLPAFARQRLESPITVASLGEAQEVVALLRAEVPPPEPTPTPDPTPTPGTDGSSTDQPAQAVPTSPAGG